MRALPWLSVVLLAACGPKVSPNSASAFDEDLPTEHETQEAEAVAEAPRPEAPPGRGLRSGVIARAKLLAVLDGGPGAFLRQLEIAPHMDGKRFIGWQLVQLLDRSGPLYDVDVAPGDVLLAVNGRPLSRPDQLQGIWDSLRTANELRAQLWRGASKLELAFAIEPKVDPAQLPPPAAKPDKPAPSTTPAKPAPPDPGPKPPKPTAAEKPAPKASAKPSPPGEQPAKVKLP
jgi:hypothetical protein